MTVLAYFEGEKHHTVMCFISTTYSSQSQAKIAEIGELHLLFRRL
jgi:hypothetical protein